ncbi:MFS transporter, SP family, sugar:H+ symporter [Galdieria sulphuraria]|uniref:MFS transporter, SP family, sugar:H+ symporter n=1 Tax=Galdieria sulphuraria TaxID=130081 RepID=M2VSW1_GALSU|nr:MFS transporter, SP family, sugar:H+ symporter [Galdieria sulphuraria]EME26246.1 MFS transporter, SP family, sugar:H+ symporter [Galdieria sulphuraria]|eukprot:XP_005702766.1 MFS transporter, SP family, sugar:H+ symporter [Galdieria sulphuraria]
MCSVLRQMPWKLILVLIVGTFGGSVVGIDTALVGGAQLFFIKRFNLDASLQGLTIAATLLGALVGSLLSTLLNSLIGRRGAMFLAGLDAIAAGFIEAFSNIWGVLLFGRLILGVSFGVFTSTIPVFLSEFAPTEIRGIFTTVYQVAYVFGYFIGFIVDVIFVNVSHGWRFMLGAVILPATVDIVALSFSCESPRWLLSKGRLENARNSLLQLRKSQEVADRDLEVMSNVIEKERQEAKKQPSFFRIVYDKPSVRRALTLGLALQIAQQFSGVNAVMFYFDYVLQLAGLSDSHSIDVSLALGFGTVIFGLPTFWLVDRVGRRILLLSTMPFVAISLWMCGFSFFGDKKVRLVLNITGTLLFRLFLGPGIGPMPWVITAEIFPWQIRTQCLTLNSFCSYMLNFVVSFSWPTMLNSMHAQGAFGFFGGFTILSTIFIFLFLPETKGLEMEATHRLFEDSFFQIAKKNLEGVSKMFSKVMNRNAKNRGDDNANETQKMEENHIRNHTMEASSSSAARYSKEHSSREDELFGVKCTCAS